MQYLDFMTSLNPFVLALLVLVLICGAYDRWSQPH